MPGAPFVSSRLCRLVLAICPPADRPWLDAFFGETAAAPGTWARAGWLLGGFGFVFVRLAAGGLLFLGRNLRWLLGASFTGAITSFVLANAEIGRSLEAFDASFRALGAVLAIAFVGLACLAYARHRDGDPLRFANPRNR